MKLNCKPGDLAIVLSRRNGAACIATGKFVEVVRSTAPSCLSQTPDGLWFKPHPESDSGAIWLIKYQHAELYFSKTGKPRTSLYDFIPDSRLRPIRDPGPDAVDETLIWLPALKNEGVAA